MSKQKAHIEKWVRTPDGGHLVGMISSHPRQKEFLGTLQVTSPLVMIDEAKGIAETMNTMYTLGEKA